MSCVTLVLWELNVLFSVFISWEPLHASCLCPQIWDETFQRVSNEQEIYEGLSSGSHFQYLCYFIFQCSCFKKDFWFSDLAQLHDLMQLKQENSYLTTIARQISPYILSIAKVKERLEPRCSIHSFCWLVIENDEKFKLLLPLKSRPQTTGCMYSVWRDRNKWYLMQTYAFDSLHQISLTKHGYCGFSMFECFFKCSIFYWWQPATIEPHSQGQDC